MYHVTQQLYSNTTWFKIHLNFNRTFALHEHAFWATWYLPQPLLQSTIWFMTNLRHFFGRGVGQTHRLEHLTWKIRICIQNVLTILKWKKNFNFWLYSLNFQGFSKVTINTSMIEISAIAFQTNFVHKNTSELSRKVNISYFWVKTCLSNQKPKQQFKF